MVARVPRRWKMVCLLYGVLCLFISFLLSLRELFVGSLVVAVFCLLLIALSAPSLRSLHSVSTIMKLSLGMALATVALGSLVYGLAAIPPVPGIVFLGLLVSIPALLVFASAFALGPFRDKQGNQPLVDTFAETFPVETSLTAAPVILPDSEFSDPVLSGQITVIPLAPTWTFVLIAFSAILFYLTVAMQDVVAWGGVNRLAVLEMGQYYRMLTAMFLHLDFGHLLFNMLALYQIGRFVERYCGHARFLAIYLLGGLCGSLASILFNDSFITAFGASGAVLALFGAALTLAVKVGGVFTSGNAAPGIIATMGLSLIYGLQNSNIDNWGHLGGIVGGVFIAWIFTHYCQWVRSSAYGSNYVVLETRPRATRNLVVASVLLPLLLSLTILYSASPRIVSVDNFEITLSPQWRTLTSVEEETCTLDGITCILMGLDYAGGYFEFIRFSSLYTLLNSLETIDSSIADEFESQNARLRSRETIQVGGREAIQRVYDNGNIRQMIVIIRDKGSILRFLMESSRDGFERHENEAEAILSSLRFAED